MTDAAAATKAGYMKDYLVALRRLPPGKQDAVLAGLEALVEEIESASRSAWLPISANLRITAAVFRELGEEGAHDFYAQWIQRQTETPVWSHLVGGALKLFGLDPGSLATWMPRSFDLMYRGYGRWNVTRTGPTRVELTLSEMPPALALHTAWQRSVRSGTFALYRLTRVQGDIRLDLASAAHPQMTLVMEWR